MDSQPPYSIAGVVNGRRLMWPFETLEDVMKHWAAFAPHRIVPGTQDQITSLTLMFGDLRVTMLLEDDGLETQKAPA